MAMTSTWPDSLQLKRSSPDAKLDVVVLVLAKTCLQWIPVSPTCIYGCDKDNKGRERERGGGKGVDSPLYILKDLLSPLIT